MEVSIPADPPGQPNKPLHIGWKIFWGLLFLPSAWTYALFTLGFKPGDNEVMAGVLLLPLCAIYCGVWVGWKQKADPTWVKVFLAVFLTFFFGYVNFHLFYMGYLTATR